MTDRGMSCAHSFPTLHVHMRLVKAIKLTTNFQQPRTLAHLLEVSAQRLLALNGFE